jgi:hypothetical protein
MTSEITIETLENNEESAEISCFIDESINGTIFHHPRFLSYHAKNNTLQEQDSISHLVFRLRGKILGFLPGVIRNQAEGPAFLSPARASFGGLVTHDISFAKSECMVTKAMDYLFNIRKVREAYITPPTSIYMGSAPNENLQFLYLSQGFHISRAELAIATRISPNTDFPDKVLKDRVKRFVRQGAERGLSCRIEDSPDNSYAIILANQRKFKDAPTHSLQELRTIRELFPDKFIYFVAYHGPTPVAVITLVLCNKNVAFSFYICHLAEASRDRPIDFLFKHILVWLKERNFMFLDFGPSTFGFRPHQSLIFFKEGFGGKGVVKFFYRRTNTG